MDTHQGARAGPGAQEKGRGGFAGQTSTPDRTPRTSEQSAYYTSESADIRQSGLRNPSPAEAGACASGDHSVPPRGRAADSPPASSTTLDLPPFDGPLGYDSGWEQCYRFEVRVSFVEGPPNPDLGALVTQLCFPVLLPTSLREGNFPSSLAVDGFPLSRWPSAAFILFQEVFCSSAPSARGHLHSFPKGPRPFCLSQVNSDGGSVC